MSAVLTIYASTICTLLYKSMARAMYGAHATLTHPIDIIFRPPFGIHNTHTHTQQTGFTVMVLTFTISSNRYIYIDETRTLNVSARLCVRENEDIIRHTCCIIIIAKRHGYLAVYVFETWCIVFVTSYLI